MKLLNQILNKISSAQFNQVHTSLGALHLIASSLGTDEDILNSFCVLAFDEVPNKNFTLKEYINRKADSKNGLNLVEKHLIAKEVSKLLKDASAFYDSELPALIKTQSNFKKLEDVNLVKTAKFGNVAFIDGKYHLVNPLTKNVTAEYIVMAGDINFAKLHEIIGEYRKADKIDNVTELDGNLILTGAPEVINELEHVIKDETGYYCEAINEETGIEGEVPSYALKIYMGKMASETKDGVEKEALTDEQALKGLRVNRLDATNPNLLKDNPKLDPNDAVYETVEKTSAEELPEGEEEYMTPSVSEETIQKYKERGFVEEGSPEYEEFYNAGFTLKKSLIPGENGKALYTVIEIERYSSKENDIEKKADDKPADSKEGYTLEEGNDYYQIFKNTETGKFKIWDVEGNTWEDTTEYDDIATAEKEIENLAEGLPEKEDENDTEPAKYTTVWLYPGSGAALYGFATEADGMEEALENVASYLVEKQLHSFYMTPQEYQQFMKEYYDDLSDEELQEKMDNDETVMYVDGGQGAVVYITGFENAKFEDGINEQHLDQISIIDGPRKQEGPLEKAQKKSSQKPAVEKKADEGDITSDDEKAQAVSQITGEAAELTEWTTYGLPTYKSGNEEYAVASDEKEVYNAVVEDVKSLLDDMGYDSFMWDNMGGIQNFVDTDWFEDARQESNEFYARDIAESEPERFKEEAKEYGITVGEEIDDDTIYAFAEKMKENQEENPLEWYINNFGKDSIKDLVKEGKISFDIPAIVDAVINIDGAGHVLAGYDGQEVEQQVNGKTYFLYRQAKKDNNINKKAAYKPFTTVEVSEDGQFKVYADDKLVDTCKTITAAFEKSAEWSDEKVLINDGTGVTVTYAVYDEDTELPVIWVALRHKDVANNAALASESIYVDDLLKGEDVDFLNDIKGFGGWFAEAGLDAEKVQHYQEEASKLLRELFGKKPEAEAPVEASAKPEVKKEAGESYGWVVNSEDAWDKLTLWEETVGAEQALRDVAKALGDDELSECLAYIFRMNDFKEGCSKEAGEDEEEIESAKKENVEKTAERDVEHYSFNSLEELIDFLKQHGIDVLNAQIKQDADGKYILDGQFKTDEEIVEETGEEIVHSAKEENIEKKAEDNAEYFINKVTVPYSDAFKYNSVAQGLKETSLGGDKGDIYFNPSSVDFTNDSIILNNVTLVSYWEGVGVDATPEEIAAEIFSDALDSTSLNDALNVEPRYLIENNSVESSKKENINKKADEELKQFDMKQELDGQKEFEKQDDFSQVSVPEEKEDTSEVTETMEAKPEETKGESFSASEFGNNMAYIQQNNPEAFKSIMNNLKQLMVGDQQKIYDFLENWASHNFQDFTAMTREDPTYARHSQYQEQLKNNVLPKLKEMSEYKQAMEEKVSAEKGE